MNILALSGSLRAASINSALLRAAARLAPPGMTVTVFDGLAHLSLFNPDLDSDPPAAVAHFRSRVADADALLIASPEYAHGITGVMKNALDWLVSFEPFAHKPVAVLNASPRAIMPMRRCAKSCAPWPPSSSNRPPSRSRWWAPDSTRRA